MQDDKRGADDAVAKVSQRPTLRGRGSKRRFVVLGIVVLTVFVVGALVQGFLSSHSKTSNVLVGRTQKLAPTFTLANLANPSSRVSLSAFRAKPLVLNFWASWCVPCRAEMPLLERAYRAEKGNVQFLGVDSNETPSAGLAFYDHVHVTYPAASDPKGSVATRYGLFGLPTTIFISPSGKIVGRFIGQLHSNTLLAALKEAFHE
jgi:cytochrome c biogenesis protein CcmG/thiol:disulfide interchange protein DsbE